jgi:hypothetical protein
VERDTLVEPGGDMSAELFGLLDEWYDFPDNNVGGWLHIVTDDCNVDDGFIDICVADMHEFYEPDAERDAVGVRLAAALKAVPEDEREGLLNEWHRTPRWNRTT